MSNPDDDLDAAAASANRRDFARARAICVVGLAIVLLASTLLIVSGFAR